MRLKPGHAAIVLTLLVFSLPSGCASGEEKPFKLYEGPTLPKEQVATVKTRIMEYPGVTTRIYLDSKIWKGRELEATSVELRPGTQPVSVLRAAGGYPGCFGPSPMTRTYSHPPLVLRAEAGKTYLAVSDFSEGRYWYWIEDTETNKVVAGQKPAQE